MASFLVTGSMAEATTIETKMTKIKSRKRYKTKRKRRNRTVLAIVPKLILIILGESSIMRPLYYRWRTGSNWLGLSKGPTRARFKLLFLKIFWATALI